MLSKNYKPVLYLLITALLLYTLHKAIFYWSDAVVNSFYYSIETLYLFFTGCSVIIIGMLIYFGKQKSENYGMTFIWLTGIKIAICCLMLIPLFANSPERKSLEKMNFFMMFILYLAIETVLSIRILNNKQ